MTRLITMLTMAGVLAAAAAPIVYAYASLV